MSLAPAPGVVAAELGDEVALHDRAGARFHVLDRPGALVWRCFDGVSTLDEIVADIVEVFGTDEPEVRAYVVALVEILTERGLLVDVGDRRDAATDRVAPSPLASASRGRAGAPA